MPDLPPSAPEHYAEQQLVSAAALTTAEQVWGEHPPEDFDGWFESSVDKLVSLTSAGRARAMSSSSTYVTSSLAQQGIDIAPEARVNTSSLVGIASDGRPLESLLYGAIIHTKADVAHAVEAGAAGDDPVMLRSAWKKGRDELQKRMNTQIADAERAATGLEIITRPRVAYIRLVRAGACSRCTVLAGRVYRWSEGFLRHPLCMCRHVPTTQDVADDLTTDPKKAFDALTLEEQDRIFTINGARAIREGADIAQVVNVRRGNTGLQTGAGRITTTDVYGQDLFTSTEGTTKRGIAGKIIRARGRDPRTTPRLMPETIFEIAENRDDALRLLEMNGYVFDRSVPQRKPRRDPRPRVDDAVDLDKVARERAEAERLAAEQLVAYLDAEKKYLADVKKYLAAEKRFIAAERKRLASLTLSDRTRKLIAEAQATLPKDRQGWRQSVASYPTDANGALLVPEELARHLDSTLEVGAAIRRDTTARIAKDAGIKKLKVEQKALAYSDPFGARRREIPREIARRERAIIETALAEVRGFGGAEQKVSLLTDPASIGRSDVAPATRSAVTSLRRAEKAFPTDWLLAASTRGDLVLGSSDRAFFSGRGGGNGRDFIAASAVDYLPDYRGAFTDYPEEVLTHELGHRMEQAIPGLTHLEYALVRRRSIKNGVLEPLTPIYSDRPELASELGYADEWREAYAGKSYEGENPLNPASIAAEAFQVGLQDTFGRSYPGGEFDTSEELQEFVMGVLALL